MRIVGGSLRGRKLIRPQDEAIRPTSDRVRESLFNMLSHRGRLEGARVLDIFAGTGALGIEALSRGAISTSFVEKDPVAAKIISENLNALDLLDRAKLVRRSALFPGDPSHPHDLIFADPPYGQGLGEQAVAAMLAKSWFAPDCLLVLEEESAAFPIFLEGFQCVGQRSFGKTMFGLFTLKS